MLLRILGGLLLVIIAVIAYVAWSLRPLDAEAVRTAWMTQEDRIVTVDGEAWRVRESGPDSAPTLVLIHGFSHSLEAWDPWADRLDNDFRIIRFDLPGHGLTGPREDAAYSVDDTVSQVSALLDQIAPETFILGGNSLGGLVAWRYADANPEAVSGLILVSPGGYPNLGVGDEPAPVPDAVRTFLTLAPKPGVDAATAALYADPSKLTGEQLDRIHAMMRVEGNGDALVRRIEQFTLPDPNPALSQITIPSLILWGDSDGMIPPTHAPRFNAALQNSRLLLIENAGHLAMEEQPDITAEAVRAFLSDPSL